MMDENKDMVNGEVTEEAAEQNTVEKAEEVKPEKIKKIKNQALFKRGGYSVAITALVLAGIILFNWLVSALSARFNLEFDMSSQKINSISEENIDYIKGIKDDIDVIVCGEEKTYADYMDYYASNLHNAQGGSEYYKQTVTLINKYAAYNKKINVSFVDPQSTEFTKISSAYSNQKLSFGDIIVSCKKGDNERVKVVTFDDIYNVSDESGYAQYGYPYTVSGSNIETALTGAIAYAASSETKKVALITGHSVANMTEAYTELLKSNNYEVSEVSDAMLASVPDDADLLAIVAPTVDFLDTEIKVLTDYLENDGMLGHGIMVFFDASNPVLPNLNEFLAQWGIDVGEGILFETDDQMCYPDDPTTMVILPGEDEMTADMSYCVSGYNVPLSVGEPAESSITTAALMTTSETVAVAPSGVTNTWSDYKTSDLGQFAGVVLSSKETFVDNEQKLGFVAAFSSTEFFNSQWAEQSQLSNKDIVISVTDKAANVGEIGIHFVSKTITNESFADKVTDVKSKVIRVIFVILLPIGTLAAGFIIFRRRRNAE